MAVPATVHPLQPRFAQAITGALCLEGTVFQTPPAVAVAWLLVVLSLAGPRWSPVAWAFRRIAPPARELEPAAPPRFAQGMAAVLLTASLALFLAGMDTAAWVIAAPGDAVHWPKSMFAFGLTDPDATVHPPEVRATATRA